MQIDPWISLRQLKSAALANDDLDDPRNLPPAARRDALIDKMMVRRAPKLEFSSESMIKSGRKVRSPVERQLTSPFRPCSGRRPALAACRT
jgi:hypothetical protein